MPAATGGQHMPRAASLHASARTFLIDPAVSRGLLSATPPTLPPYLRRFLRAPLSPAAAARCLCINGAGALRSLAARRGDGSRVGRTQLHLRNQAEPAASASAAASAIPGGGGSGLRLIVDSKLDAGVFFSTAPHDAAAGPAGSIRGRGNATAGRQPPRPLLPNKRTVLQLLSGPAGPTVREWVHEAWEDCRTAGGSSTTVEFALGDELAAHCGGGGYDGAPLDGKDPTVRQYVRLMDRFYVAAEPCDSLAGGEAGSDGGSAVAPATTDIGFYLECCQCPSAHGSPS